MVSQAGKLNRFDLVQQISFLACQFQRGAARQVEKGRKKVRIYSQEKVKIKVKVKMKLSILQHPLLGIFGVSKKNGNKISRTMLGD